MQNSLRSFSPITFDPNNLSLLVEVDVNNYSAPKNWKRTKFTPHLHRPKMDF